MAAGGPAGAALDKIRVRYFADYEISRRDVGTLDLQMALKAEVVVALDQQLSIERTVRAMARGATFAQGFVLEDEWPALFAVTLRALFVQARHGEAAGGFHDVVPVRVVALHAIHVAFNDRMMLRQVEFRMDIDVALKTRPWVLAGIHDEPAAAAADAHVFAGWAVAGFAAAHARELDVILAEAAMRAVRK